MNFRALLLSVALAFAAARLSGAEAPALPPPVPGFPIGWCIRANPEAFAQAKRAGFEHVELAMQDVLALSDEDFVRLVTKLRALNVRAFSGYNCVPRELRLVGPDVDLAKQAEHLAVLLTRASLLKLDYLVLNAGAAWRVPEGVTRQEALKQLRDFGRRFALVAGQRKITVLLEPLRAADTNLVITLAEAIALVRAVDRPNFQLMVDYSFLRIQHDDLAQLRDARGLLRHVHIANPEKTPRAYPLEKGESNYAEFFALLKEIDYRGGLSIHAGTQDFDGEAPRALAFLRHEAAELAK